MLSKQEAIAIGVRLFALFLAVYAFRQGAQALVVPGAEWYPLAVWLLFGALLPALLALVLWFFPLTVAHKLLPVMRDPDPPATAERKAAERMDGSVLFELGCTLLGLWLLAAALSDTLYWSLFLLMSVQSDYPFSLSAENVSAMVTTVAEIAIALWLLLGNRGILRLIRRLRASG